MITLAELEYYAIAAGLYSVAGTLFGFMIHLILKLRARESDKQ